MFLNKITSNPKISIITPSLNSGRFIEQTILSVLNQDYSNYEHIIIDGGSQDQTLDIISHYPHLVWISELDKGQADALNKGFRVANGEIIGWLNADDTYNPGAFSSAANYLFNHPDVGMIFSNCNHIDESNQLIFSQNVPSFDLARELIDFQIPQPTIFVHAEAVKYVGYTNPKFHFIMDVDLFLNLGRIYRIDHIDTTLANFRMWGNTKTTLYPEKFWLEFIEFFDHFFLNSELPESVTSIKQLAYARAYWILGCIYLTKSKLQDQNLGQHYANQAISILLRTEEDRGFLIDQVVHWCIKLLPPDQIDNYINNVFTALQIRNSEQKKLRRKVRGYIYASLALQKEEPDSSSKISRSQKLNWVIKALKYDARWISNRGIQSTLMRLLIHQ